LSLIQKLIRLVKGSSTAAVAPTVAQTSPAPTKAVTVKPPVEPAEAKAKTRSTKVSQPRPAAPVQRPPKPAANKPWHPSEFEVPVVAGKTRFQDLDLPDSLLHSIADLGFRYSTPIQAGVLEASLQGRDCIGQAQTGTGKTAAFLITAITRLLRTPQEDERFVGEPRALVLAPTRELAMQIADDARGLCKHTPLKIICLVGGIDYQKQQRQLDDDVVDIVVATPGRLIDFLDQKLLNLHLVDILVIDEADRMLDMGFIPQIKRIVRQTPNKGLRQTLLFSATFPFDVKQLAQQWTENPLQVQIAPEQVASDNVKQLLYLVTEEQKYTLIYNLLKTEAVQRVIIFANRRDQTRRLTDLLQAHDVVCEQISGEVEQNKRIRTLERFKSGELPILIATDVAGRGLHVDHISHVINFSLPEDPEDYIHRIGRTGRAGNKGVSISFAGEDDAFAIPRIEALLGRKLECSYPSDELLQTPPKASRPVRQRPNTGARKGTNHTNNNHQRRRS
jgi:ATP-dependent RNA helicase RhlB